MSTRKITKEKRAWQTLHSELDRFLRPYLPGSIVLAISGGPDSRALLESIARWPMRLMGRWLVVCIDHGVRPQSAQEAQLTIGRAQALGFMTRKEHISVGNRENEQSLREKRYAVLKRAAEHIGAKFICCAHHRDDNAEGYLMAMLGVGGGALGAAMSACEPLGEQMILRPFVNLSKNDLLLPLSLSAYTDFVLDNLDQARVGERAYIRHEIMPALAAHTPQVAKRLDQFARIQRSSNETLAKLASPLIQWGAKNDAAINLSGELDPLMLEHAIRQVLKKWCSHLDLRQSRPTVEKIVSHVMAAFNTENMQQQGLDRPSKWFIVSPLEKRIYQLPGAEALVLGKEIIMRRV